MKIAYVVSGLTLTFVVDEMEAHEQAGWEVLPLVSCRPDRSEGLSAVMTKWRKRAVYRPCVLVQMGVTLREMITHPLRFCKMCFWTMTLLFHSPVEFAKAVYELATVCYFRYYCRQFGAEHIHVHFASRSLNVGIMLGILTDLPVSCTVHAFDIFMRTPRSLRPRLAKCKFIAAVSRFNIEYLRRICGQSIANLCHLVHCGIDLEKFSVTQRVPEQGRIICVCRLIGKKGVDLAIRACSKLINGGTGVVFEIVGEGPRREHLEDLIGQLGVKDSIKLLGSISNDQLKQRLSRASIFLMPCIQTPDGDMDGIPVAMMEAMACEVPVVSRRISGIPELVQHDVNGLLVDEEEPGAIAEAVRLLLTDPDKISRFGQAAREKIKQDFNIMETAAQLRKLICPN
jgi:colanic acid/amylovoran biosynthesis glycosyltransferase